MQNHGLVCKINKGLWEAESQRAKAGSETPNKNERLHGEELALLPPLIPVGHTSQIKSRRNLTLSSMHHNNKKEKKGNGYDRSARGWA
jgi:hypothetical protein